MKDLYRNKHFVYPFAAWLLVTVWFLAPFFSRGIFDNLKAKTNDWFTYVSAVLQPDKALDKDIVVVAVDNESLAKADMKWPWKRSYHADLIEIVESAKPAVIGIDFVFAGKSTEEDDFRLAEVLSKYDNIVLAADRKEHGRALLPYESFSSSAKAVGYVNKPTDPDGVVRKARLFIKDQNEILYTFELHLMSIFNEQSLMSLQLKDNMLYWGSDFAIPVNSEGIVDLAYRADQNGYAVISATDVFEGNFDADFLKDKIVLFGSTAKIIHDEIGTPFGSIPGVFVLANTTSMILNSDFLSILPYVVNVFVVLLLGLLIIYSNRKQGFVKGTLIASLVFGLWLAASIYLRMSGYQMDFFNQGILILGALFISNTYKYCYLIYISNKLKNLAVSDPVTGFFSIRYMALILDQKIKAKEKNISLVAMGIREYKSLSKRYGFDDMKGFMRGFARFLETQLRHKAKKPLMARAHGGNFYMLVSGVEREQLQTYLEDLIHQVWSSGFSFGDSAEMIHLSIVLSYTPIFQGVSGKYIYSRTEEELAKAIARNEDAVAVINVHEKIWDSQRSDGIDDELEFLSVDIEERNRELEEALKQTEDIKHDVEEAYFAVVMSLVKALEEKDTYTQGHSERAAKFARSIANEVGMSSEECDMIYKAGLLHDIGKIGVPETILHKKGRLTDEDFAMIKKHPVMGKKILEPIKAFEDILPMVLFHHEKYDGTGYPHGLHGDSIPAGAQILAVADCFDAITCGRGYKQGTSLRDGMKELERCSGSQFNPIYVQAFKRVLNME